ncbi:MAG: hypothetical protein ACJA0U_003497 [Salibacteraceae bacterium]|jgi:hypothetical protein
MRNILLVATLFIPFLGCTQDTLMEQQLDDVQVRLKLEKEIAFSDSKHFILDFHIGKRGIFLLLKQRNNYFAYLLDNDFKVEDRLQLDFKPKELFSDCFGILHILGRDSIYQLENRSKELFIYETNPIDLYDLFLKGCIANNSTHLIFKRLDNFNKTTVYYGIDKTNNERTDLYLIEDPLRIRNIHDTYDSLIIKDPGETAIMEEVKGYDLDQTTYYDLIHEYRQAKYFFDDFSVAPEHHPIIVKKDTTYIFDNLNDLIVVMNDTGYIYRRLPLKSNNSIEIELDKKQDRLYSVSQEKGVQVYGLLSSDNFEVIRKTKITKHAYPRKAIVYNGYAYYLYKEFMEDNFNKLFRQRI